MFEELAKMFGIDPNSNEAKLAQEQVRKDRELFDELIMVRRRDCGDSLNFANSIGVTIDELSSFESDPLDFDFGFVRRYAHGLGLLIEHFTYSSEHRANLEDSSKIVKDFAHRRNAMDKITWKPAYKVRGQVGA